MIPFKVARCRKLWFSRKKSPKQRLDVVIDAFCTHFVRVFKFPRIAVRHICTYIVCDVVRLEICFIATNACTLCLCHSHLWACYFLSWSNTSYGTGSHVFESLSEHTSMYVCMYVVELVTRVRLFSTSGGNFSYNILRRKTIFRWIFLGISRENDLSKIFPGKNSNFPKNSKG
jgi:hypothetical protein